MLTYLALFAAGAVASVINVLAGGGSFLTLPVLIFAGLPAVEANATNRVGVLAQNAVAVWGFHRFRVLGWRWAGVVAVPAVLGAVLGTWAALVIPDETFERVLAVLMVALTLWTLLRRQDRRTAAIAGAPPTGPLPVAGRPGAPAAATHPLLLLGFFLVGVYGGFVQAGVGFLVLAATSLAGLDLVRGNAIKVLAILALTLLSLGIFAWQGAVRWPEGLALALGSVLGGQIGVHLTVLKGHRWLQRVVTATVVLFAVLLWLR
ncbi:MAG TPA: sulfite exporter TauE/SafE family protein [Thermoanaerobaculia bacterium]|nr:sulfite exporter TauE/SafE family protein [Thermoanaerobaculia bacterium]